jgi:ABC-type multidrug transport system fused ATPase/permease subunit
MTEEQSGVKRPTGLWVLFVLTSISTSLGILQSFTNILSGAPNASQIKKMKLEMAKSMKAAKELDSSFLIELIEKMEKITASTIENFVFFNSISLVFYALGLAAAIYMFRGLKIGFHMYIIYSFLTLIQYYFIISPSDVPIMLLVANGMVSLLFIFLYSRYLNWMQPTSSDLED